jgi:hypothetical protein
MAAEFPATPNLKPAATNFASVSPAWAENAKKPGSHRLPGFSILR